MKKKELKKMDDERLKRLYESLKRNAIKDIRLGSSIVYAICLLNDAEKIEDVLIERGIEV